jgi:hypothetical protein
MVKIENGVIVADEQGNESKLGLKLCGFDVNKYAVGGILAMGGLLYGVPGLIISGGILGVAYLANTRPTSNSTGNPRHMSISDLPKPVKC